MAPIKNNFSDTIDESSIKDKIIQIEARLGGSLFSNNDLDAEYQFFCLNEYTWILYQLTIDSKTKQPRQILIRYHIYNNHIYKQLAQDGDWQQLSLLEVNNLKTAIILYKHQILTRLYPHSDWLNSI